MQRVREKKKIERKERREERERAVTGSNVTERVQGGKKTTKIPKLLRNSDKILEAK